MPLLHKSYSLIIPKLPHVQEFKMYVYETILCQHHHIDCISHLGGNCHLQFTTASSNMSPLFIIITFISSTCITDLPTGQWPVTCLIHSSFTKPVHNSCAGSPVSMLTLTSWLQHADATLFSCEATLELMLRCPLICQGKLISVAISVIKGCLQKKIAEKETLVHMGGRGVKKIPFF